MEGLSEDALIHLFRQMDHESILNLMLVCKDFERIITNNFQLSKNFKTSINCSKMKKKEWNFLVSIRRKFGQISIRDAGDDDFKYVLRFIERMGSQVVSLKIEKSSAYTHELVKLLNLCSNLKELSLSEVELEIEDTKKKIPKSALKCTLPQLKNLVLISVSNARYLETFFQFDSLHHLKFNTIAEEDWPSCEKILSRQKKLRSLELSELFITNLDCSLEMWNSMQFKKLILREYRIPKKEIFETFSNLLKTQKNIQELDLSTVDDEADYHYNYSEILTHLLNLKTLDTLTLDFIDEFDLFPKLPVKNLGVKSLSFKVMLDHLSYNFLYDFFPNIEKLSFHTHADFVQIEDLCAIESLKCLKELKFDQFSQKMLRYIESHSLNKLSIGEITELYGTYEWEDFADNVPNIEYLELPTVEAQNDVDLFDLSHFFTILESFSKLKSLKSDGAINSLLESKLIENIRLYGKKLESLKLTLKHYDGQKAVELLKKIYPNSKCEVKTRRLINSKMESDISVEKI